MAKRRPSFINRARKRTDLLVTNPELFPELYDPEKLRRRMVPLRVRQQHAAILAEHLGVMDRETRRCGSPSGDGSMFGLSEKQIANRTGWGDPRTARRSAKGHMRWRGRRTQQRHLREERIAGYLEWGKPEQIAARRACNPRHIIERGRHAGRWRLYPSVRKVSWKLLERLRLDKTLRKEVEDLKRRRAAGLIPPIVDVQLRRARDRQIKRRQRAKQRAVAACQRTPRRNE